MSKTRNNHYVPQWYQHGFIEPGQVKLQYLDLSPDSTRLADGRIIHQRSRFQSFPSQCFSRKDLYSTFFGAAVNDEIERKLFGDIDAKGAAAVRAFIGSDTGGWIQRFEDFFLYIDAQKIRTPKGLDWLQAQYPTLSQNELMFEMQGIRAIHCAIWSGGVREIVSAENSPIKFITTDHPVTIYNHAAPPGSTLSQGANDPAIALKGSQTIFPLDRDHCLILTNLEYARDPDVNPLEKRTFARNFQHNLVKADALIRERKLDAADVARINLILKSRARRYIAAGQEEWLYPEKVVADDWSDLRATLQPPEDGLWHFGGEMMVSYTDGRVDFQDEFGRKQKQWDFLDKSIDETKLRNDAACGCGSGEAYAACCKSLAKELRRSWAHRSIRERNLFLQRVLVKELQLETQTDWVRIRQEITDEQISKVYRIFTMLWPRETDLLQLLPKPDGQARAVYTGCIHPSAIAEFAIGASLYFGEVLIEHPFAHGESMREAYSPIENPKAYRQEFLKSVIMFLTLMPLVDMGLVNLVPDAMNFDLHLRDQIMHMAETRAKSMGRMDDPRVKDIVETDARRSMMALPEASFRAHLRQVEPDLEEEEIQDVLKAWEKKRKADPLAVLQQGTLSGGKDGGLLHLFKLAPNFEMAMYLAQATGACIITDSIHRWREIQLAMLMRPGREQMLRSLTAKIAELDFGFPMLPEHVIDLMGEPAFREYPEIMRAAGRYLTRSAAKGLRPNWEQGITARYARTHFMAQTLIRKRRLPGSLGRIVAAIPQGGLQDNSIHRLLLMSSSEHHLHAVPMAFYISKKK